MRSISPLLVGAVVAASAVASGPPSPRWTAEKRLTSSPESSRTSFNFARSIAADRDHVHVVWYRDEHGVSRVFAKRSADGGATWGPDTRLSLGHRGSEHPAVAVATVELEGRRACVGWVDYRDANEEEYVRRSTDGGATWGPVVRLTSDGADSWAPSIAVSGRDVFFFWFDRRNAGVTDADVERALDKATALVGLEVDPAPPRDASVYYVAWYGGPDGPTQIYFRRAVN